MNTTEIAVDDLLQIVKAYVNQNAELKAVVAQQKQQIQQLQNENKKMKENNDKYPYLKKGEKVDNAHMEIIEPDGKRIPVERRIAEINAAKEAVKKENNKDGKEKSNEGAK